MGGKNTFQTIIAIVFGVFALLGVFLFATQRSGSGDSFTVEIWGTFDEKIVSTLIEENFDQGDPLQVEYTNIDEDSFDSVLVEALAEGNGPDAILLSQDRILRHEEKVFLIPYESFSVRDFRDSYINGAEIFLKEEGVVGLPFIVDPMVMYWNRAMFSNARIAEPPRYWDEFSEISDKITQSDFSGNILKSTVAFGEFRNVSNAKDVISTLMLQAGTPIIERVDDKPRNAIYTSVDDTLPPAETVMRFYTEFADPSKPNYSWNRSLPNSLDMFLAGDLAIYFGFVSDIETIRASNPNLDFDVALFPQIRDTNRETVFADISSFAVLKRTANPSASISAIGRLTGSRSLESMQEMTLLPPVSKSLLGKTQTDAYRGTFYDSALISQSWLDPDSDMTDNIFETMVEDITSGRLRISSSVNRASKSIDDLLQ